MRNVYIIGFTLIALGVLIVIMSAVATNGGPLVFCGGLLLVILGAVIAIGQRVGSIEFWKFKLVFWEERNERSDSAEDISIRPVAPPSPLPPPADLEERRAFAATKAVPRPPKGLQAHLDLPNFQQIPTSDPLVPMYLLDEQFRIVDWNDAFRLAFDGSMEGLRGVGVLEWVYILKNYKQVIEHAEELFGHDDSNRFPLLDEEVLEFEPTKHRYKPLTAIKRAYRIPTQPDIPANQVTQFWGWLVLLDVTFSDETRTSFYRDLLNTVQLNHLWTEYAISYDAVLNATDVYPLLLRQMIGASDDHDLTEIGHNVRILELGAGTGNLTQLLAQDRTRLIVAIENNPRMFEILREKCRDYLVTDMNASGVVAIRQDLNAPFSLENDFFDFVVANNVIYSLQNPVPCFEEARRVLKVGGEIRISGPKKSTKLSVLFQTIKNELKRKGTYDSLREHFIQVERINRIKLSPFLFRWEVEDVQELLREAGFSDMIYSTDCAYAGQSMIVCANKSDESISS